MSKYTKLNKPINRRQFIWKTGIGFLGAGVIIHNSDGGVKGITTASGLWVVAAIGLALGIGMYLLAIFAAILAFLVIAVFWKFTDKVGKKV